VVTLLLLGAVALRSSDLRADPPVMGLSMGPLIDEGYATYSARSLLLTGRWRPDDFLPLVVYPLFSLTALVAFKLLGFGFVQVRLISVIAGSVSVLLIFMIARRLFNITSALLAGLLLASCYPLVMYSRIGIVETLLITFLLALGYIHVRGFQAPRAVFFGAFLCVAAPLFVKPSALFIIPAFVVTHFLHFVRRREPAISATWRRTLALGLTGAACAIGLWAATIFLPFWWDYLTYVLRHSLDSPAGHPASFLSYLLSTLTVGGKSWLARRAAWLAVIGIATLPAMILPSRSRARFFALWYLFGLLQLGYMFYRPDRYELVLLPVLILSGAGAIGTFIESGTLVPASFASRHAMWLTAACWWLPVTHFAFYTEGFWGLLNPRSEAEFVFVPLGLSVVLAVAVWFLTRSSGGAIRVRPRWARWALAAVPIALILRLDLSQYASWFQSRSYHLVSYAAEVDQALAPGSVLAGSWAPTLLLGSSKRAICISEWANRDDPVGRFGVTHVVSQGEEKDWELFRRLYPQQAGQARIVRRFELRGVPITVRALMPTDRTRAVPGHD
jgi:4-amino-4-deoxy-L-arabinose transferase-like glycosyltransferase